MITVGERTAGMYYMIYIMPAIRNANFSGVQLQQLSQLNDQVQKLNLLNKQVYMHTSWHDCKNTQNVGVPIWIPWKYTCISLCGTCICTYTCTQISMRNLHVWITCRAHIPRALHTHNSQDDDFFKRNQSLQLLFAHVHGGANANLCFTKLMMCVNL